MAHLESRILALDHSWESLLIWVSMNLFMSLSFTNRVGSSQWSFLSPIFDWPGLGTDHYLLLAHSKRFLSPLFLGKNCTSSLWRLKLALHSYDLALAGFIRLLMLCWGTRGRYLAPMLLLGKLGNMNGGFFFSLRRKMRVDKIVNIFFSIMLPNKGWTDETTLTR